MIEIGLPIYWIALIGGTLLLLAAVLLGDLFEGVFGAVGFDVDVAGGGAMPPLLAFVALFGAGGLIGETWGILWHPVIAGIATGGLGALGAALLFRVVRRSEGAPERGMAALVGRDALVTVEVRPGAAGEVEVAAHGTTARHLATSAGGTHPAGSIVRVTGLAGTTLVVSAVPAAQGEGTST